MSFPCFTIPYRNEIIGDGERKEIKWSIKVFLMNVHCGGRMSCGVIFESELNMVGV